MTTRKNRAGRHVKQIQGYKAFIPAPLPPDPPLGIDMEMQGLLSTADRALGRLDGSILTLPDPDLFVFMYVRKEAVLSSQIEGTQSSLDDLLNAEAKIFDPERPEDVDEIINYVNALNYGLRRLGELPVSVRLIREIHERLLSGVRGSERQPGELRKTQNWIGPSGATLAEATFVPPPPDDVPPALSAFEKFIHKADTFPALVKIGLSHAQFETIHPFLDGNGRMGRLLITFMLCEKEILQKPVLYLSHYFRRHRSRYYDLLQSIRDDGDWEAWIKFFLRGVSEVSRESTETARQIVSLREHHRRLVTEEFGRATSSGLKVLEKLYSFPIVTVNNVMKITGSSFPAANQLTGKFVSNGILSESTGRTRNRRFRYDSYIGLFSH